MSTAEMSDAFEYVNSLSFPRRDISSADCEKMIVWMCGVVPKESEMLVSSLCAFINTVCVKVHIAFSHKGITSVFEFLLKWSSQNVNSVFVVDALKALGSVLIENGERCSSHFDDIVTCVENFTTTACVNLEAKYAALLALANLCAKAGKSLRESSKARRMLDIFIRNFKVHSNRPRLESGDPSRNIIARLLSSILFGIEMVLTADPSLHGHIARPEEMLSSLHRLMDYRDSSASSLAIAPVDSVTSMDREDSKSVPVCHRERDIALSQPSRVRVHTLSLLSCAMRRKDSPIRRQLIQRLALFIPHVESEALARKPYRTSLTTLLLHDPRPKVRSGAMLLAGTIVHALPLRLIVRPRPKTQKIGSFALQSTALSLSERTRRSIVCLYAVFESALKREQAPSTMIALLQSVDMAVQATPWDALGYDRLVNLIRALRPAIEDMTGGRSAAEAPQRTATSRRNFALRTLAACLAACNAPVVEKYLINPDGRFPALISDLLLATPRGSSAGTHTPINSDRVAALCALAKSFPNILCRRWEPFLRVLERSFASMQAKNRASGLRIADALFRAVGDGDSFASVHGWDNFVMGRIVSALRDPSAAVRTSATICLSNIGTKAWKILPADFGSILQGPLLRAIDTDSADSVRAAACRLLGVVLSRCPAFTGSRNIEHIVTVLASASSDSKLAVRVAASCAIATMCAALEVRCVGPITQNCCDSESRKPNIVNALSSSPFTYAGALRFAAGPDATSNGFGAGRGRRKNLQSSSATDAPSFGISRQKTSKNGNDDETRRASVLVSAGRALLRACADHDRVVAHAVRGVGSVTGALLRMRMARKDRNTRQLLVDCMSKLRDRASSSSSDGASAHKIAWNACAAIGKVVVEWTRSEHRDAFISHMRVFLPALCATLEVTTNYKVKISASEAIGAFLAFEAEQIFMEASEKSRKCFRTTWISLMRAFRAETTSGASALSSSIEQTYRSNLIQSLSNALRRAASIGSGDDRTYFLSALGIEDDRADARDVKALYEQYGVVPASLCEDGKRRNHVSKESSGVHHHLRGTTQTSREADPETKNSDDQSDEEL